MHIHDVLIIGAGPAGLAVAARLHEHTPSATFTDDEHQRYHWIKKHGRKMNIKNYRTNTDSLSTPPSMPASSDCCCKYSYDNKQSNESIDILVLDSEGSKWMTRWHRLFDIFTIDHLRSPMFFHLDPADRDSLLRYTYEESRETDLWALPGCVGKEITKHRKKKKRSAERHMSQGGPDIDQRDRNDYFNPSTSLFAAHCDEVARRYRLENGIVRHERVLDIKYDYISNFHDVDRERITLGHLSDDKKVFLVTTNKGIHFAYIIVLAVGSGNVPSIPPTSGLSSASSQEGYSHAMELEHFPPPFIISKIKVKQPTNLLIIGGGLTSVQIADLAIRRGVDKVFLLMRGSVKVKYFDVDLDWVGKFRNVNQAIFWSADTDEERLEMLLQARNGGSITPRYRKILDAHISSGKISLHTNTTLTSVSWHQEDKAWRDIKTTSNDLSLPKMDYIVFATGIQSDLSTIPYLQTLREKYPVDVMGGMPCLNDDLMWSDDVPLFINGRMAGLRLGPGAPNLIGARIGAERIAWNITDILLKAGRQQGVDSRHKQGERVESRDQMFAEYVAARKNRFDSLVEA